MKHIIFILIMLTYSCCPKELFQVDGRGEKHGIWIERTDSTNKIISYKHGVIHGRLISYKGDDVMIGKIKNGQKTGTWKYYFRGNVWKEITFKNGEITKTKTINLSNVW